MEKREAAWHLFESGRQQKEIAKILDVTEQTVVRWKKADNWEKKLSDRHQLFESNADMVQKLINYQLRTINKMVNEWEETESPKLIGKGEIDALSKLYSTIKRKDIEWTNYIQVMKEFMSYLSTENLVLSKQLIDYADNFLNETRQQLQ